MKYVYITQVRNPAYYSYKSHKPAVLGSVKWFFCYGILLAGLSGVIYNYNQLDISLGLGVLWWPCMEELYGEAKRNLSTLFPTLQQGSLVFLFCPVSRFPKEGVQRLLKLTL